MGNPLKRIENNQGTTFTTTLRYDSLYRQTQESRTPNSWSRSYEYDEVGNRTSRTLDQTTVTYTYDDNDKLTAASDNSSFGYDASGNLTSVSGPLGTWSLSYGDDNQLTSVTYPSGSDSFTYNALGQRMRAVLNGTARRYVYLGERVFQQTDDSGNVQSQYTLGGPSYADPMLQFSWSGGAGYPAYDGIGTVRQLLNSSGTVTDGYDLDTFGRPVSASGSTPNPYRFGGAWGYVTDASGSGLQQLGARYYWPEIGRFIQQDLIGDGMNWYAYVDNNPLMFINPTGWDYWSKQHPYWTAAGTFVDNLLMLGRTANYGKVTGEYDSGCASLGGVVWAGAQWGGMLAANAYAIGGSAFEKPFQPYWKYVSEGADETGPWLARGWKPPYGRDFGAAQKALATPHTPVDVVPVKVPWWEPVAGPRVVRPLGPNPGGGWEWYRAWKFPN